MRVGLNVLYLLPGKVGGSEVYAKQLIDALARTRPDDELVLFAADEATEPLRAHGFPANVRVRRVPVQAANKPLRSAAEQALLPVLARRAGCDLLHSLGTTAPIVAGMPNVMTILDLIYEHFPETFPAVARLGLKAQVGPAARTAGRVCTISESVKRDVVQRLRVDPGKVDVTYLGFGMRRVEHATPEAELRERLGLGEGRVLLCVSAALVHKNLPRLIEAFAQLGAGFEDVRLVLAGHAGREHHALTALAAARGVADRVTLTGWISDEDMEGLYGLATACAYPSLHEGFGMPVLEAMARDRPLACSNATSLPEVAGDAAELFDPEDVGAIAAAVRRVLSDPDHARDLVERGRARVGRFTWEGCARDTWAAYERAL